MVREPGTRPRTRVNFGSTFRHLASPKEPLVIYACSPKANRSPCSDATVPLSHLHHCSARCNSRICRASCSPARSRLEASRKRGVATHVANPSAAPRAGRLWWRGGRGCSRLRGLRVTGVLESKGTSMDLWRSLRITDSKTNACI